MKVYLNRIDLKGIKFEETGQNKQSWVQIFRPGIWKHPTYGTLKFTNSIFNGFVNNFKNNVRKVELALDQEHQPEKGAAAWIKQLDNRGDSTPDQGLWALVEWTSWGLQLVADGVFKYLSGDFDYEWRDEETQQVHKNVLFGAALTNRPFIKGMSPINLSEFRKELEEDKSIEGSSQLAKDLLKLKEGNTVKTDQEIMAAKEEDLTPEEKARKAELVKLEDMTPEEKKKEEEKQLAKKKLAERAKRVGLAEDATEEEVKKKEDNLAKAEQLAEEEEELEKKRVELGLPENATKEQVAEAEKIKKDEKELSDRKKKLQEEITPENEQRIARAKAVGLPEDATLDQIEKAEQEAVKKKEDEMVSNINMSDIASAEKKLSELKKLNYNPTMIKLMEENLATRKKLHEQEVSSAKEKIELQLKEHFREGKLTAVERDTLKSLLFAEAEGGSRSYKLSEKDKDGKEVEVARKLSEVVFKILSERPAIVELQELAQKELKEPAKEGGKELGEEEVQGIAGRVAGRVTPSTKSARKLAERAKAVGLSEKATLAEVEAAEKNRK